jgi:hypothetical protein
MSLIDVAPRIEQRYRRTVNAFGMDLAAAVVGQELFGVRALRLRLSPARKTKSN